MKKPGSRLLIVNADDLGRTPGINEGVFAAHTSGILTSATLMVNFPASRDAASKLADHPALGVGLHVALTGGRPTLEPDRVPSLVDAAGNLPRKPEDLRTPDPNEILAEVRAQLGLFRELVGKMPSHLDSHHHSHRRPEVCDALIATARENGLPVRNAGGGVGDRLRAAGIATTDFFVERFFGEQARVEILIEILKSIGKSPPGSTELMCHPARVDEELRLGSSYAEPREQELAALIHPDARDALEQANIRLIHFGDL